MNPLRHPLLCLTVPIALTALSAPDVLESRVETGQILRRSVSFTAESELIEFSSAQNGEEVPEEFMGEMDRCSTEKIAFTVVDEIGAATEGTASAFARTYEEVSGSYSMELDFGGMMEDGPISEGGELTSVLAGERIAFEEKDGDFVKIPAEGSDLKAEDLEGLVADAGFDFLLPTTEVVEDDTWELESEYFMHLVEPAGDLLLEPEDQEEDESGMGGFGGPGADEFTEGTEPDFDGKVTLTHAGRREVDGRSLIVVRIAADFSTAISMDMSDRIFIAGEDEGDEEFAKPDSAVMDIEETYEGAGEYLFDPELGLMVSLDLKLNTGRTMTDLMEFEIPEMGALEFEQVEFEEGLVHTTMECGLD